MVVTLARRGPKRAVTGQNLTNHNRFREKSRRNAELTDSRINHSHASEIDAVEHGEDAAMAPLVPGNSHTEHGVLRCSKNSTRSRAWDAIPTGDRTMRTSPFGTRCLLAVVPYSRGSCVTCPTPELWSINSGGTIRSTHLLGVIDVLDVVHEPDPSTSGHTYGLHDPHCAPTTPLLFSSRVASLLLEPPVSESRGDFSEVIVAS